MSPRQRRFLVINFRVGTRNDGYLVGPILVSTHDFRRFHYWDEPEAVLLEDDDFEILVLYPLGMSRDEAAYRFGIDFPPLVPVGQRYAQGWQMPSQHMAVTA